ncbi:hypothetical protein [Mycolicibacterium phocaicum]|uniref:hypothetical protein n=1 Tax=Mycolicibacterium phocaicum TaxID=319706 RepID=UPI0009283E49|nr:hypothetical protein [Mycolicibacterium phocaicum]UCZ62886.1 hypothetical protein LHJ73_12275 [Mycolicibacterium phocaicum]SHV84987.1 Uncharacterised protein [Mycobacteroides abscessus subsp. abscessus]
MIRLLLVLGVVAVILAVIMIVGGAALGAVFTSDRTARRPMPTMTRAWLLSIAAVVLVGIATEGILLLPAMGIAAIGLLIMHIVIDSRSGSTTARAPSPQESERARLVEEFGDDGLELLDGAQAAIERIERSDAATGGWLGNDLDFAGDLATIRENCRATMELKGLITELSDLAEPDSDDVAMLEDARVKVRELGSRSWARVYALQGCAEKAEEIDRSLRDDRVRAELAEKRDDVRSRMAAKLYGVEATPAQAPSSSVDKITALAAAYREIRGKGAGPGADTEGSPPQR